MARWTAGAKWGEAPAPDGQRDTPLALSLSEGLGISAASSEKRCSVPPLRLTLTSQSKEAARCALTKPADAWFCLPPLTK